MNSFSKNILSKPMWITTIVILLAFLLNPGMFRYGVKNWMFLSATAPYGVYLIVSWAMNNTGVALGGGAALLIIDIVRMVAFHMFAASKIFENLFAAMITSGIGKVGLFLPLGILIGWYINRKMGGAVAPERSTASGEEQHTFGPARSVLLVLWAGMAFHLLLQFKQSFSLIGIAFLVWSVLPYGICFLLNKRLTNKWVLLFGAIGVFVKDLMATAAIVFFPTSSTAGIGLFFVPVQLIFTVLPVGMLAGWIFSKMLLGFDMLPMEIGTRQFIKKATCIAVGLAGIMALVNLKPISQNLRKKVDLNAKIGEARVVLGENNFKKIPVYQNQGWVQADIFDAQQGLEIAEISAKQIRFLDPETWALKRIVDNNYRFSWMDKLISLNNNGQLNVLHAGGGYSKVGLLDLNGNTLWQFQPDEKLPPNKMIAVDLDGNGEKEFYATGHTGVYRLDAKGTVVWKSTGRGGNYLVSIPAYDKYPAMIASDTPMGKISMWTFTGELIKEIKPTAGTYMLQVVKWGEKYCFAVGQTSREGSGVFLMDLDGNVVFKQRIGEHFGVNGIMAVRFEAKANPCLVVVGGGGGGVHLTELNIFTYEGQLVYRELREPYSLAVVPDEKSGVDSLMGGKPFVKYQKI